MCMFYLPISIIEDVYVLAIIIIFFFLLVSVSAFIFIDLLIFVKLYYLISQFVCSLFLIDGFISYNEAFKDQVSQDQILADMKRKFLTVYSTILCVHTNYFCLDR